MIGPFLGLFFWFRSPLTFCCCLLVGNQEFWKDWLKICFREWANDSASNGLLVCELDCSGLVRSGKLCFWFSFLVYVDNREPCIIHQVQRLLLACSLPDKTHWEAGRLSERSGHKLQKEGPFGAEVNIFLFIFVVDLQWKVLWLCVMTGVSPAGCQCYVFTHSCHLALQQHSEQYNNSLKIPHEVKQ